MDPSKAAALNDATVRTGHPRNDYRTDEAKRYTAWMEKYARPFLPPGGLLIDLGCAAGKQTFPAEALGVRVIGLDCAFEALLFARMVAADIASQAGFLRGNYVSIPFSSQSFDAVLCFVTLLRQ